MLGYPWLFFRDRDIEILRFMGRKDRYREEVSEREETGGSTGGRGKQTGPGWYCMAG